MTTNPPIPADPWNLRPSERRVMSALVRHGCNKRIAAETGLLLTTIESELASARKRMGQSNRVLSALMWDRYERKAEIESAQPAWLQST